MPHDDANRPEHEQSPAWTTDPYSGRPYEHERHLPPSPSNGKDPLSGMPWWVKAIILIGVPGVIALGLTWQNATTLTEKVRGNGAVLETMRQDAQTHDKRVTDRFDRLAVESAETNRILMAGCMNDAKDNAARDRCAGLRR